MFTAYAAIIQFKIELDRTDPLVWRRIQVPGTYTFWDLHCAIQDAMGWRDYHLHAFEVPSRRRDRPPRRFGIYYPPSDCDDPPGWEHHIAHHITPNYPTWQYLYDYGDNWRHTITYERLLERDFEATYPRCIEGARACPPEDCGGIWGYQEIVARRIDRDTREWLQGFYPGYKVAHFDPNAVKFDDPAWRLAYSFGNESGYERKENRS
jgi:hypothetical protein